MHLHTHKHSGRHTAPRTPSAMKWASVIVCPSPDTMLPMMLANDGTSPPDATSHKRLSNNGGPLPDTTSSNVSRTRRETRPSSDLRSLGVNSRSGRSIIWE